MAKNNSAMTEELVVQIKQNIQQMVLETVELRVEDANNRISADDVLDEMSDAYCQIQDAMDDSNINDAEDILNNYESWHDYFVQMYLEELGVIDYSDRDHRVEPYETVAVLHMFNNETIPYSDIIRINEESPPVEYVVPDKDEEKESTMSRSKVEKQEYETRMRDNVKSHYDSEQSPA